MSEVADGCRHVIFLSLFTNISFHYGFNRVSLSLHFQVQTEEGEDALTNISVNH